jgi:nascent polypeptide-associated complex subunit alpha
MMPRNVDPRRLKMMMKQMGIKTEDIEDVKEIVMRTRTKEYLFKNPQVTMVEAQGQKTFQIMGDVEEKEKEEGVSEEDVDLVAEQSGVSREDAKKALEESGGDIADAIVKLKRTD